MTKDELCSKMNISISTLRRRLKAAGLKVPKGLIPPDLLKKVYVALGWSDLA